MLPLTLSPLWGGILTLLITLFAHGLGP
ncbi:hypothetical protein BBta_3445 [Bradyrhizobium sp. BTAi1]|nr:hypothetical protein BBta_3445 [Bradyrhizobium sp. BTAi1]